MWMLRWLTVCVAVTACCLVVQASERPNIVIVMLDDLGYSDLGCYGGEIRTPNIDSLAAGGLRYTQFYNAARCCPTRAALLTGLYPHQVGLKKNGHSLQRNGATIAELLGSGGYQTGMVGKWHLSYCPVLKDGRHLDWINHRYDPGQPFVPSDTYPANRGFDRFYGILWGVVNYFDPFSLVDGRTPVREVPQDYYMTDAINAKSVEYVKQFSESEKPFFLYVAHCAPHWPLHARDEDIQRYSETYRDGWHALRKRRYARLIKSGMISRGRFSLPELQGSGKDWNALDHTEREVAAREMAVHAAMVDRVDQGVGQLIEALQTAGCFDNTLIFVLADNGASPERYRTPGYDRPSHKRDGSPIQYKGNFLPGSEDTYGYIGSRWASAANTPFRYWKRESFEGGCHSPLIVHWPQKIAPSGMVDHLAHVMDIMPTCLDVSGVPYPNEFSGHRLDPLEGRSLGAVTGDAADQPRTLFWEHLGGRAVRDGDWKLVSLGGKPWELYDLSQDATETMNLASQQKERVDQMNAAWQRWARRVGLVE